MRLFLSFLLAVLAVPTVFASSLSYDEIVESMAEKGLILPAESAAKQTVSKEALIVILPVADVPPQKGLFYPNPNGASYATTSQALYGVLMEYNYEDVTPVTARNIACQERILTNQECRYYVAGKPFTYMQLAQWLHRAEGFGRTDTNAISVPPATAPSEQYLDSLRRNPRFVAPKPLRTTQPSAEEIQVIVEQTHANWNNAGISETSTIINTAFPDTTLMEEAYETLMQDYYESHTVDAETKQRMMEAATKAMVEALDDDYTTYMGAEKAKDFRKQVLDGDFQGIGAYIFNDADQLRIVEPIDGSPAQKAGLLSGDIIIAVDGESVVGEPLETAVEKIKGPAGSVVVLTVVRGHDTEESEEFDVEVTRGKIDVPTITLKWTESGIPVMRVHTFNTRTGNDFLRTLRTEILPENPEAIIFDFRNNTGGILDAAGSIVSAYVPDGESAVFMNMVRATGNAPRSIIGKGILSDYEGKMIILQNKYTASASEVVIAMLKDKGLVTIIGEQSFGKGSAQRTHTMPGGGLLKVTFTLWESPNGVPINDEGVTPDIMVESTKYDQVNGVEEDASVQRALEFITTGE